MKINRAHSLLFTIAMLAGCESARVVPPAPVPAPPPPARPAPPPPAPAQTWQDWRDAPQTPGAWRYQVVRDGSAAAFVNPQGETLLTLRCDPGRRTVALLRPGAAATSVPASITTSYGVRPAGAVPMPGATAPMLAIEFAAPDRQLDAIAFSRGRFMLEINGLPTLVMPAWAEIGRVVEDCR